MENIFGGKFTHWSISAGVNFPIWLQYSLGVQVERSQETIKDYCISLKNQIAWWSSEVKFWVPMLLFVKSTGIKGQEVKFGPSTVSDDPATVMLVVHWDLILPEKF